MKRKILLVFGTRPEAIKMLPLATVLRAEPELEVEICITAQHRQMLDQVFEVFNMKADYDLDIMAAAQGLDHITSSVLNGLTRVLETSKPSLVLVHGDTTTTMAASLAAFYKKIPVGHVEAGLRSGDLQQPWPEELNRRVTDLVASQYYAPTARARDNLLAEGTDPARVFVTGNTVVDALQAVSARIDADAGLRLALERRFPFLAAGRQMLLVTGHRRENFGPPFLSLCESIRDLARAFPIEVVYPVHLNPNVQAPVRQVLDGIDNVHLIPPQDYLPFVYLMKRSHVILTDSGGIQEEGPSLGKPVFVMRNVTERPEAVTAGTVKLVGTDRERIFESVAEVLRDSVLYNGMSRAHNPYGDGKACSRIADIVLYRQFNEFQS